MELKKMNYKEFIEDKAFNKECKKISSLLKINKVIQNKNIWIN